MRRAPAGAMADLVALRGRIATALMAIGPGPASRDSLQKAGLTAQDCADAACLERRRLRDPRIYPGIHGEARRQAFRIAAATARALRLASLWDALARFLSGGDDQSGRLCIQPSDAPGRHRIESRCVRHLHESLRGKPVLHPDATMRPALILQEDWR